MIMMILGLVSVVVVESSMLLWKVPTTIEIPIIVTIGTNDYVSS